MRGGLAVTIVAAILLLCSRGRALDRGQVCDDDEAQLGREATTTPTLVVHGDGRLAGVDESATVVTVETDGRLRFRLDLGGAGDAIVRIEVSPASVAGRGQSLGCGEAHHDDVLVANYEPRARGRLVVRVSIFREPRDADEERRFRAARDARLAALETTEAGDAFAALFLRLLWAEGAISTAVTNNERAAASELGAQLHNGIEAMNLRFGCSGGDSNEPFRGRMCPAITRLRAQSDLALGRLAAWEQCSPDASCASPHPRDDLLRILGEIRLWIESQPLSDTDSVCETAARVRWLRATEGAARLASVVEMPWTDDPVHLMTWDDGVRTVETARDSRAGGVIVVETPLTERQIFFRQRRGAPTSTSLGTALGRFGRLIARFTPQPGPRAAWDPCRETWPKLVDDEVPPLGVIGARAFVVRDFPVDHVTEIDVCTGNGCSEASARGTLRIVPRRGVEFAPLLEAGFALLPFQATGDRPGLAYTHPRYAAVGGLAGPDQIFMLDDEVRVGRLFTLSALLGVTFPMGDARGLAAIGVVLFDGDGKRSFTEGLARIGIEMTTHVYVTVGVSVTVLQRDVDAGQPRVIAVPRSVPATTPPTPALELEDSLGIGAGFGIALDLAAFGDAADDIATALGGT